MSTQNFSGTYVFHPDRLKTNINNIRECINEFNLNLDLAYSSKANDSEVVLKSINEGNLKLDCASLKELKTALSAGFDPKQIWISSPFLDTETVQFCIDNGILIYLDSLSQLEFVGVLSSKSKRKLEVGIRCNPYGLLDSRFGMRISADSILAIKNTMANTPLSLNSLSIHYSGAEERNPEAFAARAAYLLDVFETHFEDSEIKSLNIGGGIAGPMPKTLTDQFEMSHYEWYEYFDELGTISSSIKKYSLKLIMEPGMALVANTLEFHAMVIDVKSIGGNHYALLDTSKTLIKPTGHDKDVPFRIVHKHEGRDRVYLLVGKTCMERDELGVYEGELAIGDLVVFENVGAYTWSYAPDFIFKKASVIGL